MKHNGRIGLVRHGQTYANTDKVWHGHTDTELTELGKQQARRLGRHFHRYMKPEVIYSSPSQRARITAEAVADEFNLDIDLDPRLMEFHLGDWEGMSFKEMAHERDIYHRLINEPDFTAPNGESQNLVKKRIVVAMEEYLQRHREQNILIVAHGVAMGIALSHYLENDTTQWPKYTKHNTAFSELCLNTRQLLSFNKTDHLDG